MALGAVFISIPVAMLLAVFAVLVQGSSSVYGLVLYAMAGTIFLTSYMAFHGLFLDQSR